MGIEVLINGNQIVYLVKYTTTQINALTPVEGMLVYNTTLKCPCFYDGTGWRKISHTNM